MAPSISFLPAAQIEILNRSNWPLWSSRILTLLCMNGLRKHVTAEKDATDKDWDATKEMLLGVLEMYTNSHPNIGPPPSFGLSRSVTGVF